MMLLLVYHTLAYIAAAQPSVTCSASEFMPATCTSSKDTAIVATLRADPYNLRAESCCAACYQNPACFTWTFNTRDSPHTCFLKGVMHGSPQRNSSWCTTGVKPSPSTHFFPTPANAKNVLFIVVDDMRPMMHRAYNFSLAKTPNMDTFSEQGLTFTRAYVQYAYCSPSRNSFMTGRRPDTTKVWEFVDHFRETGVGADWVSLPEFFKRHQYITLGSGKLYHPSSKTENIGMADNDYPASWSPEWPYFSNQPKEDDYSCLNPNVKAERGTYCIAEVGKDESKLTDQKIRDSCISQIHLATSVSADSTSRYHNKPFFIGCGFHKPHVPWHSPKEFYDLMPEAREIPLPAGALQFAPAGMPEAAWHPPADVKGMDEEPAFNGTCNETRARLYRRAYYASVAYTDYNIGRVLATLEDSGHYNTTVVVIFGDHGWQLGEHNTWAKMTNFELGTRIPLMMRAPWRGQGHVGKFTDVLAEAVDLYPTLAELAGLPAPQKIGEELNGTSLAPLFDAKLTISTSQSSIDGEARGISDNGSSASDSRGSNFGSGYDYVFLDRAVSAAIKSAAYSQFAKTQAPPDFPSGSYTYVGNKFRRNATKLMGYTVRVDEWRYTAWFKFDDIHIKPMVDSNLGRELYDHRHDTGLWLDFPGESVNLAAFPEHSNLVAKLHEQLLQYVRLGHDLTEQIVV